MPLLILEPPDKHLVGAIGQVDGRDQEHRLPLIAALDHDGGDRAGGARDHEAGRAPQEVVAPDPPGRSRRSTSAIAHGDEPGVQAEVRRDRADQRLHERRHVEGAGRAAQGLVDEAGRGHGEDLGGHAEDRAIHRIAPLHVDRALRQHAGDRDEHRGARPEQEQRHQVGGVGHRQRRAAGQRDRQVDLPGRGHAHGQEQQEERPGVRDRARKERHGRRRAGEDHERDVHPRRGRQLLRDH